MSQQRKSFPENYHDVLRKAMVLAFYIFLPLLILLMLLILGTGITLLFSGFGRLVFNEELWFKNVFKGIEMLFLAPVPYLLMIAIRRYVLTLFPVEIPAIRHRSDGSSDDIERESERLNKLNTWLLRRAANVRINREEFLFVKSYVVSIFIAFLTTYCIEKLIEQGIDDYSLSCLVPTLVIIALIIVLIFYYVIIEKSIEAVKEQIENKES